MTVVKWLKTAGPARRSILTCPQCESIVRRATRMDIVRTRPAGAERLADQVIDFALTAAKVRVPQFPFATLSAAGNVSREAGHKPQVI